MPIDKHPMKKPRPASAPAKPTRPALRDFFPHDFRFRVRGVAKPTEGPHVSPASVSPVAKVSPARQEAQAHTLLLPRAPSFQRVPSLHRTPSGSHHGTPSRSSSSHGSSPRVAPRKQSSTSMSPVSPLRHSTSPKTNPLYDGNVFNVHNNRAYNMRPLSVRPRTKPDFFNSPANTKKYYVTPHRLTLAKK
jgi:hypothetical protein